VCTEDRARFFSVAPSNRTRDKAHKLKHRHFHLNIREHFFYWEAVQALAQLAHRGCGVSVLEDIQKLSGYRPGQLALGGPA